MTALPKEPWTADAFGNVRDVDGALIGSAQFIRIGDLKTMQAVARHFAASVEMADALTILLDAIESNSEDAIGTAIAGARRALSRLHDPRLQGTNE